MTVIQLVPFSQNSAVVLHSEPDESKYNLPSQLLCAPPKVHLPLISTSIRLKFYMPLSPPCRLHVPSMSLTNSRRREQRQCLLSSIAGSMEKNNFASDPTELPPPYFSLEDGHRYSPRIVILSMEQRTGENLVNPEEILPSYQHQN